MEKEETWEVLEAHTRKYSKNDWLFFQLIGFQKITKITRLIVTKGKALVRAPILSEIFASSEIRTISPAVMIYLKII